MDTVVACDELPAPGQTVFGRSVRTEPGGRGLRQAVAAARAGVAALAACGCRGGAGRGGPAILVGDLNIAPREDDVWSHKQLLKVVSHTPIETEAFEQARAAGGWVDVTRGDIPDGRLYSWWSYRAKDWSAADKGRRLDHIWATADIAPAPGGGVLRTPPGPT